MSFVAKALVIRKLKLVRYSTIRLLASEPGRQIDHAPIKERQQRGIQVNELPVIRQELIKAIPVEFHGVKPTQFNDDSEWYPIFRSPYLNAMRLLVKFKLYLTGFSLMSSLYYASQVISGTASNPWNAVILSTITLAGLTFIGDYARRLIVQIYVSKDLEHVRFCRFTFFGRRRDMVLPRECIVRVTEINPSRRAFILNIKFMMPEKEIDLDYDNYEFYELGFRLPLALGGVLDPDKFNTALGKILVNKPMNC
jgi:hypothetical protein